MITKLTGWLVSQENTRLQELGWDIMNIQIHIHLFFHPKTQAQKDRDKAELLAGREGLTEEEIRFYLERSEREDRELEERMKAEKEPETA